MARRAGSQGVQTEAAIRAAALRLIASQGYEALSMRRLAEEVDLGAAALYRYFPNKQSILFRLLEAHMRDLLAAWSIARLPRPCPAPERLEAFTRFHIRHHLPRPEGVFLSYMELRSLSAENYVAIGALRRSYERDLAEILQDGRASGTLEIEDPKVTARAIIALLTGLTTWYRAEGPLAPADIEEIYWTMVARMTGAAAREEARCSLPA